MIKLPVKFDEDSVRLTFSSRRYLLEAAIESELRDAEFSTLLTEVRKRRLSSRQSKIYNVVRVYVPTEVVRFYGMKKNTNFWWISHLKMERVNERPVYLVLVGWETYKGVDAVAVFFGEFKEALAEYQRRIKQKEQSGYDGNFLIESLEVGSLVPDLPVIPGLPVIEEPEPEPEPATLPAPTPKKAEKPVVPPGFVEVEEAKPPAEESSGKKKKKPFLTKEDKKKDKKKALKDLMAKRKRESEW